MTTQQKSEVINLIRKLHGMFWDEIFDMFPEADTDGYPKGGSISLSEVESWYQDTTPKDLSQYVDTLFVVIDRDPDVWKDFTYSKRIDGGKFKVVITQNDLDYLFGTNHITLRELAKGLGTKAKEISKFLQKEEFELDPEFKKFVYDYDSVNYLSLQLNRINSGSRSIKLDFSYSITGWRHRKLV